MRDKASGDRYRLAAALAIGVLTVALTVRVAGSAGREGNVRLR